MSFETALIQLERYLSKSWRQYAQQDPLSSLSFNEYDYLLVLIESDTPMRLTDLAQEMKVSKPSASNMVSRLQKKGLVERQFSPEDSRVKRVALTQQAKEQLSEQAPVYKQISNSLSKNLSADEAQTLTRLLLKATQS
ncbi:MarR family winged helix-turn-helix transcriptional regulator [Vibrio ulleungensis]|uniref:MarR family transcriptional regulator n=1 Tax=Vibrio ulleungensis TaxID=2807619 RepID=A0ABS2HMU1_9VIBR|nr:MarR family transcriptional regulator [Vibrio ulleungensis]MBM7038349.1 MarR family transcriptional regulator [Vibrio ulleungensis]